MANKLLKRRQGGFTLVEVGIVVPTALLVIGIIFSYLMSMYLDSLQQASKLSVMSDVNNAINRFNDDMQLAAGFQSTKSSYLTDIYAPSGGWDGDTGTATSNVLIARTIALTTNNKSDSKEIVRLNRYTCNADGEILNPILYTNSIYYLSGTNLYKRTLASANDGTSLTTCKTPATVEQTCPPGQFNAACTGNDALVASDVTNFEVRYGEPDLSGTCLQNNLHFCDVTTPEDASVLNISLTITRSTAAEPFSYTSSTTITPINRKE